MLIRHLENSFGLRPSLIKLTLWIDRGVIVGYQLTFWKLFVFIRGIKFLYMCLNHLSFKVTKLHIVLYCQKMNKFNRLFLMAVSAALSFVRKNSSVT